MAVQKNLLIIILLALFFYMMHLAYNSYKTATTTNKPKIQQLQEENKYGYILQAIANGNTNKLKILLKEYNIDINEDIFNEPDGYHYTFLAYSMCIKKPKKEIAEILIDLGADVNKISDNNGQTPLHLLVQRTDIKDPYEIVDLLIKSGANVNAPDAKNRKIIVQAVLRGHPQTLHSLINAGADINVTNSQGYSLLKLADIQKVNTKDTKYDEIITILKNAGAK